MNQQKESLSLVALPQSKDPRKSLTHYTCGGNRFYFSLRRRPAEAEPIRTAAPQPIRGGCEPSFT